VPVVTQAQISAYEALRAAVIHTQPYRPEGTAALRYHGMLIGLAMLVEMTAITSAEAPPQRELLADLIPAGDEFVRLLANLVLHTHSELAHVY
jgi:hypothetical protein